MTERSRRQSVAQIIVSFSADDSLALLDDDRTFLGDSSDESLGSSDDDQSDDAATAATLCNESSDAEENFDEAPVPPPMEPLAASGPR